MTYFRGLLLQALYLNSIVKKAKGSELYKSDYQDFIDNIDKINFVTHVSAKFILKVLEFRNSFLIAFMSALFPFRIFSMSGSVSIVSRTNRL